MDPPYLLARKAAVVNGLERLLNGQVVIMKGVPVHLG
jgi:hypothetical protein